MKTEIQDIVALILNYNSAHLTISCVGNLLRQFENLKILIVDNCSTDESLKNINKTLENQKNVVVLSNSDNVGYAAGNNRGFQYIRNKWPEIKYVLLLNPDIIIPYEKTVYRLKEVLDNDIQYAIASCQIIFNDEWRGFKDFGWKLPEKKQLIWAGTFLGKVLLKEINNAYVEVKVKNNLAEVDAIPGCFFMAKIKDLESVNYFDERTFLYFEESILGEKIKRINKKEVMLLDEYVVHNHTTKDKSLLNYKKKLFDRKCFHESKMIYIKYYSDLQGIMLYIAELLNNIDYVMKIVIYSIANALKRR